MCSPQTDIRQCCSFTGDLIEAKIESIRNYTDICPCQGSGYPCQPIFVPAVAVVAKVNISAEWVYYTGDRGGGGWVIGHLITFCINMLGLATWSLYICILCGLLSCNNAPVPLCRICSRTWMNVKSSKFTPTRFFHNSSKIIVRHVWGQHDKVQFFGYRVIAALYVRSVGIPLHYWWWFGTLNGLQYVFTL